MWIVTVREKPEDRGLLNVDRVAAVDLDVSSDIARLMAVIPHFGPVVIAADRPLPDLVGLRDRIANGLEEGVRLLDLNVDPSAVARLRAHAMGGGGTPEAQRRERIASRAASVRRTEGSGDREEES